MWSHPRLPLLVSVAVPVRGTESVELAAAPRLPRGIAMALNVLRVVCAFISAGLSGASNDADSERSSETILFRSASLPAYC